MTEPEFPEDMGAYDTAGNCLGEIKLPYKPTVWQDPEPGRKAAPAKEYVVKRDEYGKGYDYETLTEFLGGEDHQKMWIVKGAIAWGETSAWIGPPGSLKSALMADLAVSIAFGLDWHGKKTKGTGSVMYFALERADLVRRRIEAQITRMGLTYDPEKHGNIYIVGSTIDLFSPDSVAKAVRTVKNAEAFSGDSCSILMFDTFAKVVAASGGDEDKAKDQGRVFTNIERIKDELGRPHVALVGHTGKDETRGARGSNAILGDVDVMVTITGDEIKTANVTKANDMAEGPLFSFKSEIHQFGTDEDGDPVTVNIVSSEEVSSVRPENRGPKLSANQGTFYRILFDAGSGGLTLDEWNAKAKEVGIGISRPAALYDLRKALEDKNMVREYGGQWKVNHHD